MTQKIKLMTDDEIEEFCNTETASFCSLIDECEKRATDKMREACKWFYMNITQTATSLRYLSDSANNHFELMFQQFLKEQDGKE